jgi:hypothetical protein
MRQFSRKDVPAAGRDLAFALHTGATAAAGRWQEDARIAELEKSLAEFERSEPAAGKAGETSSGGAKPWDESVDDELKELDRR